MITRLRAAFAGGARRVVAQAPTGFGKTHTVAALMADGVTQGKRYVFAAHLDSLVEDTAERLRAKGLQVGYVQAGRPSDPTAQVQVCSLQTMHARGERPPGDLLIVDECHRAMAATVRPIVEAYPLALGLTATPQRGDGQPLGDVFDKLVPGPSVRWLTERNFLVDADVIAPESGEVDALAMDPVDAYRAHTNGSRALLFAADLAHAAHLQESFSCAGIGAMVISGETLRHDREYARKWLAERAERVLINVSVCIEGWDCPPVDAVILARPFSVCGSFLQAIGRGLRPSPGKELCTVVDLRGSVWLHGLPDEERAWSLSGEAVRPKEAVTSLRYCAKCLAVVRAAEKACVRCGASLTARTAKLPRVLQRAVRLERVRELPPERRDEIALRGIEKKMLAAGKPPWLAKQIAIGIVERQRKARAG
jgi:superfamily II DNA or RNA helicase